MGRKLNLVCCLFFFCDGSRGLTIAFLGSCVNPRVGSAHGSFCSRFKLALPVNSGALASPYLSRCIVCRLCVTRAMAFASTRAELERADVDCPVADTKLMFL